MKDNARGYRAETKQDKRPVKTKKRGRPSLDQSPGTVRRPRNSKAADADWIGCWECWVREGIDTAALDSPPEHIYCDNDACLCVLCLACARVEGVHSTADPFTCYECSTKNVRFTARNESSDGTPSRCLWCCSWRCRDAATGHALSIPLRSPANPDASMDAHMAERHAGYKKRAWSPLESKAELLQCVVQDSVLGTKKDPRSLARGVALALEIASALNSTLLEGAEQDNKS